jgi:methylenetetrahydrofolate dehydrogenase (NADP+) / methenyltetrahydrofolate cyclohydrolase
MAMNEEPYGSASLQGIMPILEGYNIEMLGKHAVVVGRSPILSKPMALMLLNANANVTICHSKTKNLPGFIKQADILVGAVGRPGFIKAEWIKDGAVAVDAGYLTVLAAFSQSNQLPMNICNNRFLAFIFS